MEDVRLRQAAGGLLMVQWREGGISRSAKLEDLIKAATRELATAGEVFPELWSAAIAAGQRLGTTAEYQMLAALGVTAEQAKRALERLREGKA